MQQGIYKEYQTRKYNDANVKGRIDVSRHIRQNIPFAGNIAYTTREYAQDNHLTQLIRHTIEYIARHKFAGNILCNDEDTTEAVSAICSATPTYQHNERQRVMNQNLRPVSHPYYGEYRPLQQLCLQILRQEEMKYGRDDDEIYGVLFEGAWLWESYLNTILPELGFIHADNNLRINGFALFNGGGGTRYPDFYKDDFVIDAKYKSLSGKTVLGVDRDDIHQVIAYMYRLRAHYGGFAVPWRSMDGWPKKRELLGYGGWMNLYGVVVDEQTKDFSEYVTVMQKYESDLLKQIKNDYEE
jgi:5-methylcytosine-specific restriction endonuclease McrBC regulatory subunit McrC